MVKYREILRQRAMGISIRNIAFSCGCSTATVVTVVDRAKARGLEWPLPEEMNDAAIRAVIYPREPKSDASKAEIDHERVDREMERPGVTLMVLWSEYCDAALASGKEPYMYSAFCQRHRKWAMANKVAMHIERKPAQEMQVDYVGDAMGVLDLDTGELPKVYVFAACLPYSGELYAEGFYDMKEESWVEAHVHAFSFYGGSVPIIVPDNLKQGVAKNTVEELVVNEQYRRMAEHYGCAIVPARPRKPRDKGAIEMGVRVIEQRAMAPLRDRVFTSLAQLNGALMEKVREINARPFQKRDGSRDEVFIRQEKPLLVPLPGKPYEMVTRKTATVNFNYHVAFGGSWYSVPFSYVKREVEVCATKSACGSHATASASRCTDACATPRAPTPRTRGTCPTRTATSPNGTGTASAGGRGKSARRARPWSTESSSPARSSSSPTAPAAACSPSPRNTARRCSSKPARRRFRTRRARVTRPSSRSPRRWRNPSRRTPTTART